MTVGIHTVNLANVIIDYLRGTAPGAIASLNIQLHTADPGPAGTSNVSAVTTRQVLTLAAGSGGQGVISNSPVFTMTSTETISHVSIWSHISTGIVLYTGALSVSKSVVNTDTITFTTATVSLTPLMA